MTTIYDGRRQPEGGASPSASAAPPLAAPVAPGRQRITLVKTPPAGIARPVTPQASVPEAARAVPVTPSAPPTAPLPAHDLPVLEAFRGIAALMVVVTHVGFTSGAGGNSAWAGWLSRLDFGVALFFLLSGFLLFRPFVQAAYDRRPAVDVRSYIRRRYVRIYPAFLVVMAVNWILTPRAREASGWLWLQTLFLVQNYPADFINQLDGLVQTWSLVVEVSFYLFLPVLAWLVLGSGSSMAAATRRLGRQQSGSAAPAAPSAPLSRRAAREAQRPSPSQRLFGKGVDGVTLAAWRPGIVLVVFALVALTWRIGYSISSDGYAHQLLWLPAFLDWFAAGMALAWLRERPQPVPEPIKILARMPGVCWSLALAGYWMITTNLGGPYGLDGATTASNITKHITYVVIATLLLIPAVFGERGAGWRQGATHPVMTWLGRISFGVFLWHPMLMETIRSILRMAPFTGGFWITLVLTMAASLLAGTLSWKYVEEPLQRRWRNGFDNPFRTGFRQRPPLQPGSVSSSAGESATAAADAKATSAF